MPFLRILESTWKNHAIAAVKNTVQNLGMADDDEENLTEAFAPVQLDDDDDNFVDPDLCEDMSGETSRPHKGGFKDELESYCDRRKFNQKDWTTCEYLNELSVLSFVSVFEV